MNAEAKMIVKSKTILTEEIGLNEVLEEAGIEVNETDLAEFILANCSESTISHRSTRPSLWT